MELQTKKIITLHIRGIFENMKNYEGMFSQEGKSFIVTVDAKLVRLHRERHDST